MSLHNLKYSKFIDDFFVVKKIIFKSDIEESIKKEIFSSLNNLQGNNIFSLSTKNVLNKINKFNIINEYKVKKHYPSSIEVNLKETKILAYFIENNSKVFLGENGKKIKKTKNINKDLPLIVGLVDINKFLILKKKLNNNGFNLGQFKKFYFFKSNRWDLIYQDELIVKLPIDNIDNSLKKLKQIIESLNLQNTKIIDFRIKNKIIFS